MRFYVELIAPNGSVLSRVEGEVVKEDDLGRLISGALEKFMKEHPNKLLANEDESPNSVVCGRM
ncbi:MAG: hypothetical protein PHY92_00145 [Alphaproteobacteria bacterium]|nr:hypothetical protein [Alphaproteobacteria bacterium]